ncbi:hypothetical protein C8R44DRAFT_895599 [Mycena epipterygia]|nr:hypothetical protein C8R44DRAFT_895599 [Mycena epipterygia]
MLAVNPDVSRTYTYALLPPATRLPRSKARTLRFSSELVMRDEHDAIALSREPIRPRGNNNKNTNARAHGAYVFGGGGGLLLSGNDLEFGIRHFRPPILMTHRG